jgi:hypothetical protein
VVGSSNADIPISADIAAGAILGDLGVTLPIFVDGDPPPGFDPIEHSRVIFGRNRKLQPELNTTVSAVALIRSFNPTLWRLEQASAERFAQYGPARDFGDAAARAFTREQICHDLNDRGVINLDARVAHLIVLHNPFAANRIDLDVFGGPHDEQWCAIETVRGDLGYAVVAFGRAGWEVPGALPTGI